MVADKMAVMEGEGGDLKRGKLVLLGLISMFSKETTYDR